MELLGYPFKTKLFWLGCDLHPTVCFRNQIRRTKFDDLFNEFVFDKKSKEIFDELKTKDFSGYSCICIQINFFCNCNTDPIFVRTFKSMKQNESLRFVTKIVQFYTFVDMPNGGQFANIEANNIQYRTEQFKRNDKDIFIFGPKVPIKLLGLHFPSDDGKNALKVFIKGLSWQTINFQHKWCEYLKNTIQMDNLILIQLGVVDYHQRVFKRGLGRGLSSALGVTLKSFGENRERSVQEMIADKESSENKIIYRSHRAEYGTLLYASSNCNYIYAINPTLVLFLNHLTFSDENLNVRLNTKHDLKRTIATFHKIKVPQLILYNGSSQDVKRLMAKLKNMDLSILKYLFIIISSHGQEGDNIETRTQTYNIYKDVLDQLNANASLKNTQIYLLINACRGDFDKQMAMEDDDGPTFEKADTRDMPRNIIIWFSTQRGHVSYLPKTGALLIQEFLQIFEEINYIEFMEEKALQLEKQINEKLKRVQQIPEFLSHPETAHIYQMLFKNLIEYKKLLDELQNFVHEGHESFDENAEKNYQIVRKFVNEPEKSEQFD